MIKAFVIAFTCLLSSGSTFATDRYFSDIATSSENARYRLEAKSPDNQRPAGRQRAFAKNFTYTLTDTKEHRVLWTYQQGNDASPVEAWVHDAGWVVVRTGWDELLAFDPSGGAKTGCVKILENFPQEERKKFVHETTAGPMWSQSSRWTFLEIDQRLCFVVRAHWGRGVIMELASGKVLPDEGTATSAQDKQWVLSTLKKNVPFLPQNEGDHESIGDTMAAIDIAAKDQISESIPLLREAEKSEYVGSCGVIPVFLGEAKLPDGALDPFRYCEYTIRHKAQTALRRLGQSPSEAPAMAFKPVGRFDHDSMIKPSPTESRRISLPKIRAGQTPKDVLHAAGGPDRIHRERHDIAWEYHVDGKDAHSVRVFWTQKGSPTVARIEKVTPPSWKGEEDVN